MKAGLLLMGIALTLVVLAAAVTLLDKPIEQAVAANGAAESSPEPPVRGESPHEPWVEPRLDLAPAKAESEAPPEPQPEPKSQAKPDPDPQPVRGALPLADESWPMPTSEDLEAVNKPRHYDLPPGAIMGLTIRAIGLHNVPVFDSDRQWALDNGVGHVPETSLPWTRAPQRNVYLAGHRLGWPGTDSHLVFYRLGELGRGDEIVLKDRSGHPYKYRVTESFRTNPDDSWVMGQVVGRDLLTLQTCTPIPTFHKRLIVRAERV